MWTVAPLIVLFCLGAAFFVLDRRMTAKVSTPVPVKVWPAQQYADLPAEDREWIFENLRLAGVEIEPPSHSIARPSSGAAVREYRVMLRCAVCHQIDDHPKLHQWVTRDGKQQWRTTHLDCAEQASAEDAVLMAGQLLDKPEPTGRELAIATHLIDLAERTAARAREAAPRPYDCPDCEEVKVRDASGRVVQVVPGHRPPVRTPAKTVNAGDTLTFPPGDPRAHRTAADGR